jgi:magnesium chelatase family protein
MRRSRFGRRDWEEVTGVLATVLSGGVSGIEGYIVRVEADVSRGLPSFATVGLGDSAVREGRDRVASAIRNTGLKFPVERITVNLAPADIRKEGAGFDLPIAIGILAATGQVDRGALSKVAVVGELALDGSTRRVSGVLPVAGAASRAGLSGIIVPLANAREGAALGGLRVLPVGSLAAAVRVLAGGPPDDVPGNAREHPASRLETHDLSEVRGQEGVKRALEIAAAGGHNLLMVGPPGVGKTMLARRLPGILPPPTRDEALVATTIHSVAGLLPSSSGLLLRRPFRAPHHTVSEAALVGGGRIPRPGEISLAHAGVLFLDELPEFRRNALEALRQPIEEGRVTITRSMTSVTFPAAFMLVTSMNPCPCGNLGHPRKTCRCAPADVRRYLSRVSGPLMDRIDLQVHVSPLSFEEMESRSGGDSSADVRRRVERARRLQEERACSGQGYLPHDGAFVTNARVPVSELQRMAPLQGRARDILRGAVARLGLSARAYHRVIRIARTIADLAGSDSIEAEHVGEAVHYRSLDRRTAA